MFDVQQDIEKPLLNFTHILGMKCVNMFTMTNLFMNLVFEVVLMVHFNGFKGQQVH